MAARRLGWRSTGSETIDDRVKVKTVLAERLRQVGPRDPGARPPRGHPRRQLLSTGGTWSALDSLLGASAVRRSAPGLRLHRPARDAGRAGEDPRLPDLPRPALRDVQPRAPGRPRAHRRRGHRHGRGQPLPVPADRRRGAARRCEDARGEHRHRRPVHGARRGQELPPGGGAHRPRGLPRAWSTSSRRRTAPSASPPASAWRRRPSGSPRRTTRRSPLPRAASRRASRGCTRSGTGADG